MVEGNSYWINPCAGSRAVICQAESFGNIPPKLSSYINTSKHKVTLWMEFLEDRFVVNVIWAPNNPLEQNYNNRTKKDKLIFKIGGETFVTNVDIAYRRGGYLRTYNSIRGFNNSIRKFLKALRESESPLIVELQRQDGKTIEIFEFSAVDDSETINQFWQNIIGAGRWKANKDLDNLPLTKPPYAKITKFTKFSDCQELGQYCNTVVERFIEQSKRDPMLRKLLDEWIKAN